MNTNDPAVSVVVPVRNEAGNIAPLVAEIVTALDAQWPFEVVYVDDGSTDGTAAELNRLRAQYPWLRRVRHKVSCGQSAAVRTGVAAARGPTFSLSATWIKNSTASSRCLARSWATRRRAVMRLVQKSRLRRRART